MKSSLYMRKAINASETLILYAIALLGGTLAIHGLAKSPESTLSKEEIRSVTNWIQRVSLPPETYRAALSIGDELAQFVPLQDLQTAVQQGKATGRTVLSRGRVLAEGYCQSGRGRVFLWQFLHTGVLNFSDLAGSSNTIMPRVELVGTNFTVSANPDFFRRLSQREIGTIMAHPRWRIEDLGKIKRTIADAVSTQKGEVAESFEENVEWKRRQLNPSALQDLNSYIDGLLVTTDGEMLLWEIFLRKHVFLQDREGRILRIPSHQSDQ